MGRHQRYGYGDRRLNMLWGHDVLVGRERLIGRHDVLEDVARRGNRPVSRITLLMKLVFV